MNMAQSQGISQKLELYGRVMSLIKFQLQFNELHAKDPANVWGKILCSE